MVRGVFQSHAASLGDRPDSVTYLLRSYICYGDMSVSVSYTYFSDVGPLVLLFQTLLKLFRFPCFRFWAQLMKVIPETRHAH